MVIDTPLLNPQQYKVRMKGKVKQSREIYFCFLVIFLQLILVSSILFLVAITSLHPRFFDVVFESLHRYVNGLFNAGESSSYFFQRYLWDARPYAWSLVFLFSGVFLWGLLWFSSRMVLSIARLHTSISWWSFAEYWMPISLFRCLGLFSVF